MWARHLAPYVTVVLITELQFPLLVNSFRKRGSAAPPVLGTGLKGEEM